MGGRGARIASSRFERGAAAVEFALISLIFIPLIFGMMGFALVLWGSQAADHAAREGARLAAVGTTDCTAWRQSVQTRGRGVFRQSGPLSATDAKFQILDSNGDGSMNAGDEVVVTLQYSIIGAPGALVRIAANILPGGGTVALNDGSSTLLVTRASTRNEVTVTSSPYKECAS